MFGKLNERGVTVLELTIITVVVGVLSMLAIPQFQKVMDRLKLKTAGRDIVSLLRLARSNAVSQNDQFGVYFDYNSNQYILFHDLANPSSYTYDLHGDSIIVINTLPETIHLGYVSFPGFCAIFKPNGSAANSGVVSVYSYSGEDYGEGYFGYMTADVLGSTGRVKLLQGWESGGY